MSTAEIADTAVTPTALLDDLRAARSAADAAEVRVLEVAVEWAAAHPVPNGGEGWRIGPAGAVPLGFHDASADGLDPADPDAVEAFGWLGIPPVAWDAPAQFAAANKMSTLAGKTLIRDALILRHRLPKIWAQVLAGNVQAWRARRIAQAVLAAPDDVVAYIDDRCAPVAGSIGPVTLTRLIDDAMLWLHAEAVELDQTEAAERRHVTVHADSDADPLSPTGLVDMSIRADYKDARDFDRAVTDVAAALKADGCAESLDVRRSMAIGILADPALAQALLAGTDPDPDPGDTGTAAKPAPRSRPAPSKSAVLYLHLSQWATSGADPIAHNETTGRAILVQQVRDWLGRADTHVVVKPVIDLAEDITTVAYQVPERLREQTILTHPTCVFPWCTTPARRCDLDHIDPWDPHPGGGQTTTSNLAPLCRHHHRLKTLTRWRYRRLDTHQFLWTDPAGAHYLRDHATTQLVSQN